MCLNNIPGISKLVADNGLCKTCNGEGRVSDCCGAPLKTVPGDTTVYCDSCGTELDMYFTTECNQCQGSGANCE